MRNPPNVLVVDDEPFILKVCERELGRFAAVTTVLDGRSALRCCLHHSYSLALVDIVLRCESGIDLLAVIRARWPMTTCVAFTASPQLVPANIAHHVLAKPFELSELRRLLDR